MRVTIVFETGAFFPRDDQNQTFFDVGYFETPGTSDIDVLEDGKPAPTSRVNKVGKSNTTIEVEHLEQDGVTIKNPVNLTQSFKRDILKKDDLYDPREIPAFIRSAYDCIFRFHSGNFVSADVRPRRFTEHLLADDKPTGNDKFTRAIANEIHVEFDLAAGEIVRLRASNTEVWSTASLGSGIKSAVLKIMADDSLNHQYQKKALSHQAKHYYLPNSDPPPMDGP